MGVLSKLLEEKAKDIAVSVGMDALGTANDVIRNLPSTAGEFIGSASEAIRIRRANELDRYQEKMEKKNPGNLHLWLMEESRVVRSSFFRLSTITYQFIDVSGALVYRAVYEQRKDENFFTLYNAQGNELGGIIDSKLRVKNPFSVKNNENIVELEMFFKDEPMGMVTNNVWKGNWFLIWDIVSWGAVRKKINVNQIVSSQGRLLAEITSRTFNGNKLTFIDIEKKDSEKAVILFALAIIAYEYSK